MIKGEIWWANLPDPRRSEPGYKRPVLIIQSDIFNKSNIQTIICAVITTNTKPAKAPGNFYCENLIHTCQKNQLLIFLN